MSKYQNDISIKKTLSGKRYFSSAIPSNPRFSQFPTEYIAKEGDRWDQLSYKFYRTPIYWSVLASANDGANGSIFVKPGKIIKIPEI
jgi:nucleoid-associated protein YgaU